MSDGSAQQEIVMEPGKQEEERPPGFFARILAWIAHGGGGVAVREETLVVENDFILRVLPHRGRWCLLDRVVITPQKVVGFLTIRPEVCEGHAIGDDAVLPGVLLAEMANQLLGVWYATQHLELIGAGKVLFARDGSYKASGFIRPGELVRIEVDYGNLSGIMKTTRRGTIMKLEGKDFLVKVGEELRGSVPLVELMGVESPKTTSPT